MATGTSRAAPLATSWRYTPAAGLLVSGAGEERFPPQQGQKDLQGDSPDRTGEGGEVPDDPIDALNVAVAGEVDRERTKACTVDLMGGKPKRGHPLQHTILETELGIEFQPRAKPRAEPLQRDEIELEYYEDGYPKLPEFLRRGQRNE